MLKSKILIMGLLGMLSLSACSIFHKGCGCPKFGVHPSPSPDNHIS